MILLLDVFPFYFPVHSLSVKAALYWLVTVAHNLCCLITPNNKICKGQKENLNKINIEKARMVTAFLMLCLHTPQRWKLMRSEDLNLKGSSREPKLISCLQHIPSAPTQYLTPSRSFSEVPNPKARMCKTTPGSTGHQSIMVPHRDNRAHPQLT